MPVRERILDTRRQAQDGDACNVINTRQTGNAKAPVAAGYQPRRGGRYDSLDLKQEVVLVNFLRANADIFFVEPLGHARHPEGGRRALA
jgi:hypothetical protein